MSIVLEARELTRHYEISAACSSLMPRCAH